MRRAATSKPGTNNSLRRDHPDRLKFSTAPGSKCLGARTSIYLSRERMFMAGQIRPSEGRARSALERAGRLVRVPPRSAQAPRASLQGPARAAPRCGEDSRKWASRSRSKASAAPPRLRLAASMAHRVRPKIAPRDQQARPRATWHRSRRRRRARFRPSFR